ncbi:MAG TPA: OmpH family outer membrane protein [Bacteroidia bacterium]|jgi:outer membrane protein|nr:OmpH family outer membrane protein [Bacteroidia bacterium]
MKKKFLAIVVSVLALTGLAYGQQKYCFVDTDYILAQSADYQTAQTTLNDLSVQWQKEVEAKYAEIDALYKNYQQEQLLLTDELRVKREAEIVEKEKEAKDFQKEKFGVDGELFKKRQELVKPIQDQIFNAVKAYAEKGGYAVIFDKAGEGTTVLYLNPKLDKSDDILDALGWKKGAATSTSGTSGK